MTNSLIEVLILAGVALFVLSRLYIALGRDEHRPENAPAAKNGGQTGGKPHLEVVQAPEAEEPNFTGPGAEGLSAIYTADRSFRTDEFLQGARAAYEMIVGAYASSDRKTLQTLVADDVYEAWDEAMSARDEANTAPFELLRIRRCDIVDAELDEGAAKIMIRYDAELGDGETTRTAKEIWTYTRSVTSPDPNWLLDDVDVAS